MKKSSFSASSRKGQTLVEAMVAISILTTGFLGMLSLLSKSFFIERNLSDQTKATYLAAEGIELVKNMVDHDVYLGFATGGTSGGWGACFPFVSGSNDYELDYATRTCPPPAFLAPGRFLNLDPTTKLYGYAVGGTATTFVRRIRITKPVANPNEIDVQSTVSWSTGPLTNQSILLEDHFFNWHP